MVELFQKDIRSCERRVEILIRPHRDHDIHELFTLSATLFFNMQYVKNAVCEQKNRNICKYLSWFYLIVKYEDGVIAEINTPFSC